jgi:MFS family permease
MQKQRQRFNWNNIHKIILIKLLTSLYFYSPYMTLFFLGRGFNYVQINSIWGIIVFTMFLMEVPTGILADRWGRHRAIQLAILLQFIGEVLFLFITDYWLLVIDAVIAGIGFAFASGALEAMVYDQLKAEERPEDMQAVMGKITGAGYIGFVLAFGLSGLLVPQAEQVNIAHAILATVIAVGLGFIVTLWLKPEQQFGEEMIIRPSPKKLLFDGFNLLRENKTLRHLLLLSVFTIAFWDYLGNLYQPYFQHIGVPDRLFGPTLAFASAAAFFAAQNVHKLEKHIGPRWSFLTATLGPGLIYLLLFFNRTPWIGVVSIILFRGFNALKVPLFADYNNRQIASHNRATVLSLMSMVSGGYTAVMGLIIGAIADLWLIGAFLFCGLWVVAAAITLRADKYLL